MSNNLDNLNSILFNAINKLDNPELNEKELAAEISRNKSITDLSKQIVDSAKLQLEAQKTYNNSIGSNKPSVFSIEDKS